MTAAYTGNGAYCFTNALHMCVLASGADPLTLPGPSFIECLTAMPFGRFYRSIPPSGFGISARGWSPEEDGLAVAVEALGWRCEESVGGATDAAVERLASSLKHGPVLIGPVDFGHLTHHRGAAGMAGFDHYVVGLEMVADGLVLHDPAGLAFALLPVPDLIEAWRAERITYKRDSFTMRFGFVRERSPTRAEMIAHALPHIRANARRVIDEPGRNTGRRALEGLAGALRGDVPEALERQLLVFSLPTVARRSTDAAGFLAEAGLAEAARLMGEEAVLWGRACSLVARRDFAGAAAAVETLAVLEEQLAAAL